MAIKGTAFVWLTPVHSIGCKRQAHNLSDKPVGALDLPSALAPSGESVNTKPPIFTVALPGDSCYSLINPVLGGIFGLIG